MDQQVAEKTGNVATDAGRTRPSVDDIIGEQASKFAFVMDDDEGGASDESGSETASTEGETEGGETEASSEQASKTTDAGKPEGDGTTAGGGRKPGIDTALRFLDENQPELAAVVRGLQTEFNTRTADIAQFERDKAELSSILKEVRQLQNEEEPEQPQTEPEEDNPLSGVPEEQRELFEQALAYALRKMGVVTADQLQKKDAAAAQGSWVTQQNDADIKKYGERLLAPGTNGGLSDNTLSPATKERLLSRRTQFSRPNQGVTWGDIYRSEFYDDDVKAAEDRGYQKALQERATGDKTKVDQARRSRTVSGSLASGAPTKPKIYDREKDRGNMDAVVERALRFAEQHIGG